MRQMWNYGTHCQRIGNRDCAKKNVPVVVQYLYDLRFGSRFFGTVAQHATYHYVLFPVTALSLDFGESSLEYSCPVSPLQKCMLQPTYEYISSYCCCILILVSPRWNMYVRWVLYWIQRVCISSESSVIWFQWVYWNIHAWWVLITNSHTTTTNVYPVSPLSLDFGESSLEYESGWVALASFGEFLLEYICPVSPQREYYVVYISSKASGSTDSGESIEIYMPGESSTQIHATTTYVYVSSDCSVYWFRWVLVGIYVSGESSTGILRIFISSASSVLCHLISVSPRWNIHVRWVLYGNTTYIFPVSPLSLDFGESLVE